MQVSDIAEADLANLKGQGYSEDDLSALAPTEVQALLAPANEGDDGTNDVDLHARAEAEQNAAAEAAAATAAAAKSSVNVDSAPTETTGFVVPQYTAEVPSDLQDKISAARQKERDAFKELMDGVIEAEAYQKVRDEVDAELDTLRTTAISAKIFEDVNRQNAEQQAEAEWKRAQAISFAAFKQEGLDYKDPARPGLLAAFNHHLKALAADQKNGNRDGQWFLTEAHKLTKADLGITSATRTGSTSPRGVDAVELPPTLRSVPVAATGAVSTDEFAHMRNLDGIELERAVARLTEGQRDRWLDSE